MLARLTPRNDTMMAITAHYQAGEPRRTLEAAWWRADGLTFQAALARIASARLESGRHSHQRRLSRGTLENCAKALLNVADQLAAAPDFHRIWVIVGDAFEPIHGAGELMVYDTADRVALRQGFAPKIVYLHAGTRVGAKKFLGSPLARDEAWSCHLHELPIQLQAFPPREVEDMLCSYKDYFHGAPEAVNNLPSGCAGTC